MDKEQFKKWWKKMLVDIGMSETQLWKLYGISQPNGNQKTNNATLKLIDFISIATLLNYTVVMRHNESGEEIIIK